MIQYRYPLDGGIVNNPFKAGKHEGFDEILEVGTSVGAAIHSVSTGKVIQSGFGVTMGYDYGHWVEILMADGIYVFTAHMLKPTPLKAGAQVQIGQQMGQLGYSGDVVPSGPHGAHVHTAFMTEHLNKATSFNGVPYINARLDAEPADVTPPTPVTPTTTEGKKLMLLYYIPNGSSDGKHNLFILNGPNYHFEFTANQATANGIAKQCGGAAVSITRAFADTLKAAAGK